MRRPPTILAAVLQGKLGKVKNSEDWLTAVVFGVVGWLPVSLGVKPMLGSLTPWSHADSPPTWTNDIVSAEILLWPWWDHVQDSKGAEPDVVMTLITRDGRRRLLLIECKRGSGLGHDQLGRQAANARHLAEQQKADFAGVVLLTSHVARPDGDLKHGAHQLRKGGPPSPLWWLSWSDFEPILDDAAAELRHSQLPLAASAGDAAACLRRWGLVRFRGLSMPLAVPTWNFTSEPAGVL